MRIFIYPQDDGSLRLRGISDGPDQALSWVLSPKGDDLGGLPYDEALQHIWIETSDDGKFIRGEKRK